MCAFVIAVIIALAAPAPSSTPNPYRDGPTLYAQECLSCHGDQGQGSEGVPALSGNGAVTANNPNHVIATIKHGGRGMPAYAGRLSAAEIAAVTSYIRTAWGNEGTSVGVYQVDAVH